MLTTSKLKKGYKQYKEQKATGGDSGDGKEEIISSQEEFFDELVDIDKCIATARGWFKFFEKAITNKIQGRMKKRTPILRNS